MNLSVLLIAKHVYYVDSLVVDQCIHLFGMNFPSHCTSVNYGRLCQEYGALKTVCINVTLENVLV